MIIPFFIPHAGCPHQCVFCNQKNITGQKKPVDIAAIPVKISQYLSTGTVGESAQIAFYGGSFTALPMEIQREYLAAARPSILNGQVGSIRLSTRPDCISRDILLLLREYDVRTIELGAQSMDDDVLARSGRGHTASDTVNAVGLLKECGFGIGLQLMPGLPGDSAEGFHKSVAQVIALKPDFVRLYPVLVIKGTPLEELYNAERYTPLSLDDAISLCHGALMRFEQAVIEVIRIGLQPTEELERPGTILAGPYHPAFRQLVESSLFLEKMRLILKNRKEGNTTVVILVNPGDLSNAIGQKRSNIRTLQKEFRLNTLRIMPDPSLPLKVAKIL
jgi:histone acetyltransferase (RNA polymerase elongator complex component)